MALALLGAFTGYFGLQTETGGRLLRRIAVRQVNQSIAGHLELGAIEFRGTELSLRDVALADPQGIPVVRLARLTVRYGLRGLLARRVDVDSVELDRPEVLMRQNAGGLNLSRAIAARHPKPAKPEPPHADKGKGWQVNLVRLAVMDGVVQFMKEPAAASADPALRVRLTGLGITAAGRVQTVDKNGEFHLALGGRVAGPGGLNQEPLSINVHLVSTDGVPRGGADVTLGSLLGLVATVESDRDGELLVRTLRLPPSLAAAFVSSWPIRVPLLLSGVARMTGMTGTGMKGGVTSADLTLKGEGVGGSVTIHGDARLADKRTPNGVRVEARGVRLSEFLVKGRVPETAPLFLALNIAPGSSLLPAQLTANARLEVPRTPLARYAFGPLHLYLAVNDGALDRLNLNLPLPGALLTADGGQREDRTFVAARLLVKRLATSRAAAVALGAGEIPALAGNGSVALDGRGPRLLSSTGPAAVWTVVAKAIAPRLRVAGTRYRGVAVDAKFPELTADQQSVDVVASLAAPLALTVELSAEAIETRNDVPAPGDARRIDVELRRLAVSYPGTRWTTRTPAHFSIEKSGTPSMPESRMALEGFALRAGGQELAADARRDSRNLVANLRVKALRFQDLSKPEGMGVKVSGLLDASVHAQGDPVGPRVDAKVSLRDGRVDKYSGLAVDVVATLLQDRTVTGKARVVAARLGNLVAEFKGPATASLPASAPVAMTVDVTNLQVANLPIPPAAGVKAGGIMQAHLEIHGTAGDPRLAARVTGHRMTIERSPSGDDDDRNRNANAKANANGGDTIESNPAVRFDNVAVDCSYASPRLDAGLTMADDKHGSLRASVSSRIPLSEVRAPEGLALKTRPVSGSLRLKNLDPDAISAFVPGLKVVRGQISGLFEVRGTVADPQLGGAMSWRKGQLVVVREQPTTKTKANANPEDKGTTVVAR